MTMHITPSLGSTTARSVECTRAARFPPLTPANENLDAAQLVQYDYLVNVTTKVYGNTFITKDADGSLHGPFNVLLLVIFFQSTLAIPFAKAF